MIPVKFLGGPRDRLYSTAEEDWAGLVITIKYIGKEPIDHFYRKLDWNWSNTSVVYMYVGLKNPEI